jgi:hypothetical protein
VRQLLFSVSAFVFFGTAGSASVWSAGLRTGALGPLHQRAGSEIGAPRDERIRRFCRTATNAPEKKFPLQLTFFMEITMYLRPKEL